jgi:hypothetical protein
MIASVVMGAGLLALVQAHLKLHGQAESAGQRRQALVLAQRELEQLRAAAVPMQHAEATEGPFSLRRRVSGLGRGLHAVDVAVAWEDRTGQAQSLSLRGLMGVADTGLSGALALSEPAIALRAPSRRPAGGNTP